MAIIAPRAETDFTLGRQPRARFDGPDPGRSLSRIGDVALQFSVEKQQRDETAVYNEARVTAIEQLGELRTRYEQDPDMTNLAGRYQSEADAIGAEIAATLPEGRARDRFVVDFRQVVAPQKQAIARREYSLDLDSRRADLQLYMSRISQAAASASSPEERNAILGQGADAIDAAAGSGVIPRTSAVDLAEGLHLDTLDAQALLQIQEDPASFLQSVQAGEYAAIPPRRLAALQVTAKRQVGSLEAKAARLRETEVKRQEKELASDVGDAIEIMEAGREFAGLAELFERVDGTEHAPALMATVAALETEGNFALLPPEFQRDVLEEVRSSAAREPADIARLERLEAIHAKTKDALKTDPLGHLSATQQIDINSLDPSDLSAAAERVHISDTVRDLYNLPVGQQRYLTNEEQSALTAVIEAGSPDQVVDLAGSIVTSFGERAPMVFNEIGARDPAFRRAGALMMLPQGEAVARTIIVGQRRLQEGEGAKLSAADERAIRRTYAEAFPEGYQHFGDEMFAAAIAHYAAAGFMISPDASSADQRAAFAKSIAAVSGQVTEGRTRYGGIQQVNGRQTVLPEWATADTVEQLLTSALPEAWETASVHGGVPLSGDEPLVGYEQRGKQDPRPQRAPRDLQLLHWGGGVYLVGWENAAGQVRYLRDDQSSSGYYMLDLHAFARAAGAE